MSNNHGEDAAKAPLLNTANVLTVTRLALVPVFIAVYLDDAPVRSACVWAVFAAAVFTDKADGHLARSRNLVADFGKIADSITDKALISSVLILLSQHGRFYRWITVIMIGRELLIIAMRMTAVKKKVIAAGRGGKIKMFFQSMGIAGLLILWVSFLPGAPTKGLLWTSYAMIGMALHYSVASTVEYITGARKVARGK